MDIPGTDGAAGTVDVAVTVGGDDIELSFDPGHLAAHVDDFAISWPEALEIIAKTLELCDTRTGVVHTGFLHDRVVGVTGVVAVGAADPSFWGYRPGRSVPSHLIAGMKSPTREICVWGEWVSPKRFDLWTCYPGGPAPREIHDPDIRLDEIDAAIAFWSVHAIIVDREQVDAALNRP